MKRFLQLGSLAAAMASVALQALAQPVFPPSGGESARVFSCFYECKPGPVVRGVPSWQEITTIMLANQSPDIGQNVNLIFVDGNENILGRARNRLSPLDLDEVHVCRTLEAAGLPVPEAGLVEMYVAPSATADFPSGVYGWVKNLLGKFLVTQDEPFAGRVSGIAKTECRLVPFEVATPRGVADAFARSGAPDNLPLVLVEDTDDDQICCGPNDRCIDVDGIATQGRGGPASVNVAVGNPLTTWAVPGGIGGAEGIDWFDNDGNCLWTLGDDLHLEDPIGACGTAIRNAVHDLNLDCKLLDLNNSLFNGQPVDVDLEGNLTFGGCPGAPPALTFHDGNGNGVYDDGEDIVLDVNQNAICD
jgi:hypothetical protein